MRVAVPIFGEDVSPRFGCSTDLLLATVDADGIQGQEIRKIGGLAPWEVLELLAAAGVTKVICGGVHWRWQAEMERRGVEVIWGVIGPAADALVALRNGTLQRDQFVCRGRRGRQGGGWRGAQRTGAGGQRGRRGPGGGRGTGDQGGVGRRSPGPRDGS